MTTQSPRRRQSTRLLSGSLATLALAVGSTAVAAPALAETYRHADPAHDAVDRQSTDATDTVPTPHNRSADLTRWTATHRHRTVTSTVHLRDVTHGQWAVGWLLQTPHTDTKWAVEVTHLDNSHGVALVRDHQRVPCDGLSRRIRFDRDTVRISVPRSCLGRPRWVQVDPASDAYDAAGHDFEDNGMRDGTLNYTDIAWSPRVHRG
jgi:hypothetical protein